MRKKFTPRLDNIDFRRARDWLEITKRSAKEIHREHNRATDWLCRNNQYNTKEFRVVQRYAEKMTRILMLVRELAEEVDV
jgi:hypothetical protein